MSNGQATERRTPRSQPRYPGTVNAPKLEADNQQLERLQALETQLEATPNRETR